MNSEILDKHPWLKHVDIREKYLQPDYYDNLLKKYIFNGESDLQILEKVCKSVSSNAVILELGPGSGRDTKVLIEKLPDFKQLTLVDLSERMLDACKKLFEDQKNISYTVSDSIKYLLNTHSNYDFVISLWSLSHSIHQNIRKYGEIVGSERTEKAITKLINENLNNQGQIFLIQMDSLSEEQIISMRQRSKTDPLRIDLSEQSPSKLILDRVFQRLKSEEKIEYSCKSLTGEPILFLTMEEALEYYLNFHLESHWNDSPLLESTLKGLSEDLAKHQNPDGTISLRPECFIYEVTKI